MKGQVEQHNPARTRFAVVGALVVLSVLSACDRLLSVEQRIERAERELAAGNVAAAMRDLKTVLEDEPRNAPARVLLARVSLHAGDWEAAGKELDRALEAGVDPASARALRYEILLAQRQYEKVLSAVQEDGASGDVAGLVALGRAQMALGRAEEAQSNLEQALAAAPDDPEALLAYAQWQWQAGRLEDAGESLRRLAESRPEFARAALVQGTFAMSVGDAPLAAESFERARKSLAQLYFPEQIAVLAGLVDARLAVGDTDAAENEIKALEARAGNAPLTQLLKARIAYARRDFQAAVALCQRALSGLPDHVPARLLLAAALVEQGALEQADAELSRVVAEHPTNASARKLLARVHLLRNRPAQAARVLEGLPAFERDADADWLTGTVRLMTGETEDAIAALEQGAAADPGNVALKLDLARAYLVAGRREQALGLLRALPRDEGGVRLRLLTVLAEVQGRSAEEAKQAIDRLVAESPEDAGLLTVAGSYLLSIGSPQDARDLLTRAVAADERNLDARLGLAAAEIGRGNVDAAQDHLRRAIAHHPADERAYLALADISLARGNRADARQWLEQAIGANPRFVESRLRLGRMAFDDGDPVRGESLLNQALAVTTSRARTLNRVGQVLAQAAQLDAALQRFTEAAALGADDAEINAAATLVALGRREEAVKRLESVLARRPGWIAPTAALVGLDTQQRRFEQALARIAAFQSAGGDAAAADELRGQVLAMAGRHAEAVKAFERAAGKRPSSALIVKLYHARRLAREQAPERVLLDWLAKQPGDAVVHAALAEHYQQLGKRVEAIAHYERALAQWRSPALLNNLAWLYHEAGDPRALELAKRAHETAPQSGEIADTYGWILVEQGRVEEGLALLETARAVSPAHPEIRYHYAAALARSGRKEEAIRALHELLHDSPSFPQRSSAESLLRSLN
jgi:putative PEP-CTERM system TPR-repeat lipoprotein